MMPLWLCGATGVGKSSVGWQVWLRILGTGVTAAFIDLEQVGFCPPARNVHWVRARNLAALWETYRDHGAESLVIVGPVTRPADAEFYREAVGDLTLCRLHASHGELTKRIMLRGNGIGARLAGDRLIGRPAGSLLHIASAAAAQAEALERAGLGDLSIDTDGLTVEQVADQVMARMRRASPDRWPR